MHFSEVDKDALVDKAVFRDPVNSVDYMALYRDSFQLQSEFSAPQKADQKESPATLFPLFPNLGFFQQPDIKGSAPTTYAASTLPMYPGIQFLIL